MYCDFFHFKEMPFSIAPDPRYLYMSARHREALAHLLYGIQSEGGFVLLTGEVGTGKTTVCRCLLEQIPGDSEVAFVLNPKLNALELLATICDELHISYTDQKESVKLYVDLLNQRLLRNHAQGRKTVLIIDEAQNLTSEVLEQIRLLTNLETSERKLLQVIMLGQPELRDKLALSELRQLSQRITARYHLESLSRQETADYIRHRVRVAGSRSSLFSPSAISRIYRLSGGIPRKINVLCDRSLLGAYVAGRERVSPRLVKQAGREVFYLPRKSRPMGWWALAGLALFGAGLTLAPSYLGPEISLNPRDLVTASAVAEESGASDPWTSLFAEGGEERTAYRDLYLLWGEKMAESVDHPCGMAGEAGLACLNQKGGIDTLRRTNRPAVLQLRNPNGGDFYALLTALEEKMATFQLAHAVIRVPLSALSQYWSGDYTLLWRPPFEGLISPSEQGEAVRWLDIHLALALGKKPIQPDPPTLDGALLQRLKEFQILHGLIPDGVAGPLTLIQINSIVGKGTPHLSPEKENG